MTSTAQQLKGDTPQTQRTLMLSGNWNKTFPAKVETESKSLTFVKKLLTVAISNITYLRSMFPEEAYANRSLDGLSLKILREKNNCDEAKTLVGWLIGAFEALEKKYLRELMLVVYLDPTNPDQVHEMYTFRFSYPEGEATCQVLQGEDRREVQTVRADDIYKATQHLLRTLVNLNESLCPLPNSPYLAMKLTYYDEVTPNDYEPSGFHPTELVEHQVAEGTEKVKVGEVTTSHHVVKLKVQAVCRQQTNSQQPVVVPIDPSNSKQHAEVPIDLSNSQQPVVVPVDLSNSRTESVPADQKVTDCGDRTPDKEVLSQERDTRPSQDLNLQSVQPPSCSMSQPQSSQPSSCSMPQSSQTPVSTISCICQNLQPDSLMLKCAYCRLQQHAACYRILQEDQVPAKHCCVSCSLQGDVPCTDPKLVKMSTKPAVALTCIYRRVLVSLRGLNSVSRDVICSNIGVGAEVVNQILNKLQKENCVVQSEDGLFSVNPTNLEVVALPRYLGVKPSVEGVVQGTREMEIVASTNRQGNTKKETFNDLKRESVASLVDGVKRNKRFKKSSRSDKDVSV